jgi:hypothetical protein
MIFFLHKMILIEIISQNQNDYYYFTVFIEP